MWCLLGFKPGLPFSYAIDADNFRVLLKTLRHRHSEGRSICSAEECAYAFSLPGKSRFFATHRPFRYRASLKMTGFSNLLFHAAEISIIIGRVNVMLRGAKYSGICLRGNAEVLRCGRENHPATLSFFFCCTTLDPAITRSRGRSLRIERRLLIRGDNR